MYLAHFQCLELLKLNHVSVTYRFDWSSLISQIYILDPESISDQSLKRQPKFRDSSWPLLSIYSKAAEKDDVKMVKRWQTDANGFLIFVRPCVRISCIFHIYWNTVDRSILCRSSCPPCRYRPGPEAEQSGHLCILPSQHLPGSRRPECDTAIHSFPCRRTTSILSYEISRLGEFALVFKPDNEPQLCSDGDICTTMGTSISPSESAACTV